MFIKLSQFHDRVKSSVEWTVNCLHMMKTNIISSWDKIKYHQLGLKGKNVNANNKCLGRLNLFELSFVNCCQSIFIQGESWSVGWCNWPGSDWSFFISIYEYSSNICTVYETRAVSDCLIRPLPASVNALLVNCAKAKNMKVTGIPF